MRSTLFFASSSSSAARLSPKLRGGRKSKEWRFTHRKTELDGYPLSPMSKRRRKKRLLARRKKANHGRKPTVGRNS